jgi:hypothetical protein
MTDYYDFDDDPGDGLDYGECQGCYLLLPLDDLGLCDGCREKLERDLIRRRDWDYSALAFGVPPEKREDLRQEIVQRYGERPELIAPKEKKRHK